MRVLVLGAGAVGGYFGGRLAEAGADVSFLVREARAKQLAAHGLAIRSPLGDLARPIEAITAASDVFDAVLLSCKAYDLEPAIAALAPAIGPRTVVVPLLNGLLHLETLDEAFGRARVAGGACYIAATLWQDGEIRHLNQFHRIAFGARDPGQQAVLAALADGFSRTPVDCQLRGDIVQAMWDKFAMLTTLAAMTCVMRANIGAIVATSGGAALIRDCLDECRAAAAGAGYPITEGGYREALALLTQPESTFTSSMLRDMDRGARIEGRHIVGDMLRRALAAGAAAPILRLASAHLEIYMSARIVPAAA